MSLPGRAGGRPCGVLLGDMPLTMQSNRKLICSPSEHDKKKTPAPVGYRLNRLLMNHTGRNLLTNFKALDNSLDQEGENADVLLEYVRKSQTKQVHRAVRTRLFFA